ncbi:hypothetical protein QQ008_09985 [Fulvivirgaceae bacterium BMA10]|uniref:Uncharacterized protein n=1 Tax=Splendidivirga corallicola TaxID=3051826 RepID=A0ABT8KLT9_9BACT|nr:hypothetical protein [Fulvivirgaceae bacterium BMA10]
MELDDLKPNWENYNTMLDESLILNLNALKERNLNRSKNEMFKPLFHEIANILFISLVLIFVGIYSIKYIDEPQFSIPGFIAVLLGSFNIYMAFIKVFRISRIEYFNSSIIELQKKVSRLTLLILKFRKFEIAMFPFAIIFILPITFKVIQNRNVYDDLGFFVFEIIFIIGLSLVGIFWINRNLYDKKIRQVQRFLAEIIKFENQNKSVTNTK